MINKVVDAWRKKGARYVAQRGLEKITGHIERNTIEQTQYALPYLVHKHNKSAIKAMSELVDSGIGRPISFTDLNSYKTSDRIFILGSGSSINSISKEKWEHIERHDSVGLNRWPVHDFVPTYHVFEMHSNWFPPSDDPGMVKFGKEFIDMLDKRKGAYSNTATILKDTTSLANTDAVDHIPSWLKNRLITSRDSEFKRFVDWESTSKKNRLLLAYLYNSGYFDQGNIDVLYRKRGSISYLIHLSVVLGYDSIVLCGVDMIDSNYFFESPEYTESNIPIPKIRTTNKDESKHRTVDPHVGKLTLDQVIYDMNDVILNAENIDLYVENKISKLHPKIPEYNNFN